MRIHPSTHRRASQAQAGRVALAITSAISVAIQVPVLLGDAFAAPTEPMSFPQLFFHADDDLSGDLMSMAEFEMVSAPFWVQEGPVLPRLQTLHLLNPELKRLAYVNAAGRSLPYIQDPNHVVNRLAAAIDGRWYVRNEFGQIVHFDPNIPNMPLLNLSTKCQRVNGKTWGDLIADFVVSEMLSTNVWEGIMWDNIWNGASWINANIPGSLDLNSDGQADHPDSADVWWVNGLSNMLARYQGQIGLQVITMGNGNSRQFPYLNGRSFEDFPYRETWAGSMQQISDWQLLGREPNRNLLMTRSTDDDFQLMRLGLCSSLIGGTHTYHHADQHIWSYPVLYDEYRVDLGKPIGSPIELGIDVIGEADFESGMPGEFRTNCGSGVGTLTTDPALVIDGAASLLGRPGGPGTWHLFLCSDPSDIPLLPGGTYTVIFNYRVVSEPTGDGYFFVGARSDASIPASDRNLVILDLPQGTMGEARGTATLGQYPNYYLNWGIRNSGSIVIDSIRIITGQGGVFRRDFEAGMALVNPSAAPATVNIEPGYYRIDGILDPITNDGSPASQVTLLPGDGLVLLTSPTGIAPGDTPSPIAQQIFAFPNPVYIPSMPAIQIAGVPDGGSVSIISPDGRALRQLAGADTDGLWRWNFQTVGARPVASGIYFALVRGARQEFVQALPLAIYR